MSDTRSEGVRSFYTYCTVFVLFINHHIMLQFFFWCRGWQLILDGSLFFAHCIHDVCMQYATWNGCVMCSMQRIAHGGYGYGYIIV